MACIKQGAGWQIKQEDGKLLPKIYKTKKLCLKRVGELERHG